MQEATTAQLLKWSTVRSRPPGQTAAAGAGPLARLQQQAMWKELQLCSQRQRSCCAAQNQLQVSLRGLPGTSRKLGFRRYLIQYFLKQVTGKLPW